MSKQRKPDPAPSLPLGGDNAIPKRCVDCKGQKTILAGTPGVQCSYSLVVCPHCKGTGNEPGSGQKPRDEQ